MKIAIIRKKYTFHGGSERYSQELIRHLTKAGHEVHVYALKWDSREAPAGVRFHKLRTVPLTSLTRDLGFCVSAWAALKRRGYDIIQTHDKTLLQDVYRAGDGCHIEWLRQRWMRSAFLGRVSTALNPYHWLILALERSIMNGHRFRKVIAISDLVRRNILSHYRVPGEDVVVIYNGVDLERFHPRNRDRYRDEVLREHGISPDSSVALFVGSGFERKGVRYLLKSLERVAEPMSVLIVGKGPAMQVRDPHGNKRVVFCGPRPDVERYYAAADVFVFPSFYEPFGNVHLEALASGLPVVTTALSGGSELIAHGSEGFVVSRPEEDHEFAQAITRLLDRQERERMALLARKKAEAFGFGRHIRETLALYEDVLSAKT